MAAADRLQELVQRLSEDSARLVRVEIDLAKAEVREKMLALARAVALAVGAAALLLVALFALVQALIDGIGEFTPAWVAALIVGVALVLIAGLLGYLALRNAKRGAPPMPEQAVAEAKAVAETLREART